MAPQTEPMDIATQAAAAVAAGRHRAFHARTLIDSAVNLRRKHECTCVLRDARREKTAYYQASNLKTHFQ